MVKLLPTPPRSTVEESGPGLRIVIPGRFSGPLFMALTAGLCTWAFGEVVCTLLLMDPPPVRTHPVALPLFWLAWTAVGCYPVCLWCQSVGGREVLEVNAESLTLHRQVFRLGVVWVFRRDEVRGLRCCPPPSRRGLAALWPPGWPAPGPIACECGGKTYRYGRGVEEAEARSILAAIKRRFPAWEENASSAGASVGRAVCVRPVDERFRTAKGDERIRVGGRLPARSRPGVTPTPARPGSGVPDEAGPFSVAVPSRLHPPAVVLLAFWLCFWGFFEFLFVYPLVELVASGEGILCALLAVWVLLWTAAGWLSIYELLWNLVGREVLTVVGESFIVRHEVFGLGRPYAFHRLAVRGLRCSPESEGPRWPTSPLGDVGPIVFDYGARTYRVGGGLGGEEARFLVAALTERFPDLAAQPVFEER